MAVRSKSGVLGKNRFYAWEAQEVSAKPGKNTKYAASSRNGKSKMYRGQGR